MNDKIICQFTKDKMFYNGVMVKEYKKKWRNQNESESKMTIKEKLLEKMSAQCGQKITEINLISWSMIEPYINELESQITKNRTFKPENKDYEQLEYTITPEMDEWMNAPMGKMKK